jgi:hypothetical protein
MTAHREYQEMRTRNEAPEEIRNGTGVVWWIRNGKPSIEDYRVMGFDILSRTVESTFSASRELRRSKRKAT